MAFLKVNHQRTPRLGLSPFDGCSFGSSRCWPACGCGVVVQGLVPRLGRVVPGQGIIFMSYNQIEKAITDWLV